MYHCVPCYIKLRSEILISKSCLIHLEHGILSCPGPQLETSKSKTRNRPWPWSATVRKVVRTDQNPRTGDVTSVARDTSEHKFEARDGHQEVNFCSIFGKRYSTTRLSFSRKEKINRRPTETMFGDVRILQVHVIAGNERPCWR